jgi:hypothetical protein
MILGKYIGLFTYFKIFRPNGSPPGRSVGFDLPEVQVLQGGLNRKNMKIWKFYPTLYYRVGKMKFSMENSDKPSSEVVGV